MTTTPWARSNIYGMASVLDSDWTIGFSLRRWPSSALIRTKKDSPRFLFAPPMPKKERCYRDGHQVQSDQRHTEAPALRQQPEAGEMNPKAKLTKEQVAEIRQVYRRYDRVLGGGALAKRFGVSLCAITAIIRGDTWK